MGSPLPMTASHEGAGTVVATGSSVSPATFQKGDRVMAGLPFNRCGHCTDCLGPENYKHYCPNLQGYVGVTLDGAFAEYMIADARESVKLPDAVDFETAAPLACAGVTIFRGVEQTELKAGEILGMVGAGGALGHIGIQFAKAKGLVVVGVDARDEGLALAKEAGADIVVDARQPGSGDGTSKDAVVAEIQKFTAGRGTDATIVLSDAPTATSLSCSITKMHGTVIQIAQPPEVSVPFQEIIFRDIRIKGSLISTRVEAERMLDTVARHGIELKKNLFFGLGEIPKLIQLVQTGKMAGKGMVVVCEEEQRRVREQEEEKKKK